MKKICLAIMPKTYNNQRKISAELFKLYHSCDEKITNKDTNKELLKKYEYIIFLLMLNMMILNRSNCKKWDNKNYLNIGANEVYINDILWRLRNVHHYMQYSKNK